MQYTRMLVERVVREAGNLETVPQKDNKHMREARRVGIEGGTIVVPYALNACGRMVRVSEDLSIGATWKEEAR